ncbi:MAG: hypothetical protein WAR79_05020 [Melioribacteraceae bacterium]
MKKNIILIILLLVFAACSSNSNEKIKIELAAKLDTNKSIAFTNAKALEIMKSGFNAGDGYREVWIRDYNTFIELAAKVHPAEELKANLMIFFMMQGSDGNIIDGFTPRENTEIEYDFTYSDLAPNYAGHKNTVETDQETSLIQAIYKYIQLTDDKTFFDEMIGGKTVAERMEWAMDYLIENRFSEEYGLIWGATTADWGDVQPEHSWGVDIDENTHRAIDIYDNAMFIIALDNLIEMLPQTETKWAPVKEKLIKNCREYLWDTHNQKFIPHIYLNGSPFQKDFDENEIYYFGGTAIAIEAGLLTNDEILSSINKMVALVKKAGAGSIGLTIYPAYPEGFFQNKGMYPYGYQNGGDWTWFGGRMIQQLVKYGFLEKAYEQLLPMTERVLKNDGFFEWYTINNEPRGSGTFRGSAGVLFVAIEMLEKELL